MKPNPLPVLSANGTVDSNFVSHFSGINAVMSLAIDSSQRILAGGGALFLTTNVYWNVVRVFRDGAIDFTFRPTISLSASELTIQTDQKIIVNGVVRLNTNGSTDLTFFTGAASVAYGDPCVSLQPDGRVLVSGFYNSFNELPRGGIVRLIGGDALPGGAGALAFDGQTVRVNENATHAVLQVFRQTGTEGRVSVWLVTSNDSAVAGRDFIAVTTNVVFESGDMTPKPVLIPLIDDNVAREDRMFRARLLSPTGGAVIGPEIIATIEIVENEVGVAMSRAERWGREGEVLWVDLQRVGPTGTAFTVSCITTGGTAVANRDYVPMSTNISFGPAETWKYARLEGIGQMTPEPDRTVIVQLQDALGVQLHSRSNTTVMIVDDDRECRMRLIRSPGTSVAPRIHIDGPLYRSYLMESSTDLNEWQFINYLYRGDEPPCLFEDVGATNAPMRFYRVRQMY